ncbi:MAG: hypothetical protein IJO56_01235 [Oscillospiraceae bacterium]|nr:hypothetical protein [Oscillospiraceae bacterium]
MSEFAGNVLGTSENLCVTASCGRNFVPTEKEFASDQLRRLSSVIDFAMVLAFVVFTIVKSI